MRDHLKNNDYFRAIINYLANKLSPKERNEVESICQADAFEQEAMDGFAKLKPSEIISDIESLDVIAGKKKFKHWNLVATAFIVLVILSGFIYKISTKKRPKERRKLDSEQVIVPIERNNSNPKALNFSTDTTSATRLMKIDTLEFSKDDGDAPPRTVEYKAQAKPAPSDQPVEKPATKIEKKKIEEPLKTEVPKGAAVDSTIIKKSTTLEKETLRSTPPPKSVDSISTNDTINLLPVDLGHEFYKVGLDTEPKPQGGSSLYNVYLSENQIIPSTYDSLSTNQVKVKFTIDSFGNPGKYQIIESPDSLFSQEAIRLINDGPRWSPSVKAGAPVEESTSLTITFKP